MSISDSVVWICANSAKSVKGDKKYTFVANSQAYTAPLEKDFKRDANRAHAFIGHFLCGIVTVKRFVTIRLHCNVSNLKMMSKMSTLHTSGKISADAHGYFHPFNKHFTTQLKMKQISTLFCSFTLLILDSWMFNFILFYLFVCEQTRSPQYEHTHYAERRSIKTDKTVRSARHWSRRNHKVTDIFCNCIEDRTIWLQPHS